MNIEKGCSGKTLRRKRKRDQNENKAKSIVLWGAVTFGRRQAAGLGLHPQLSVKLTRCYRLSN